MFTVDIKQQYNNNNNCLMMLYIHVNFHENISNAFNLQSGHEYMVEMAIFNVQRAIIPDLGNLKLWFMHAACLLMVLYICVKYMKISELNDIRVME